MRTARSLPNRGSLSRGLSVQGVSVQGVTVQGEKGVSVQGVSGQRGVSVRETPLPLWTDRHLWNPRRLPCPSVQRASLSGRPLCPWGETDTWEIITCPSVQRRHCCRGSLSKGSRGSLCRGSLSKEKRGSLSRGSLSRGGLRQGDPPPPVDRQTPVKLLPCPSVQGRLFWGVSVQGVSDQWEQGVSVQGVSVQGGLCPGGLCPEEVSVQRGSLSGRPLPLWTDRHLWNYYLAPNFVCGR